MTPEAEALAGMRAAPALEARYGGVIRDADAERRMQRVGRRLCRCKSGTDVLYQVRLLNTKAVNAFSLPGDRIYVTCGLYEKLITDDLLAAVLAHEMAHLAAKDHFKPRCSTDGEALSREVTADTEAVSYLRSAEIEPRAMAAVIRIIKDTSPGASRHSKGWSDIRGDSVATAIRDTTLSARYSQNVH